jgi:hypothetical protein
MTILPDVDALKASLQGEIVQPHDEGYEAAIHRWAVNAQKPAAAVLYVKNDEDVARALAYAKENSVDSAVRGWLLRFDDPQERSRFIVSEHRLEH